MNEHQGIVRYPEFLATRDGDADFLGHRLSKREAFFEQLARNPIRSRAPIDRAVYFRNTAWRRSEPASIRVCSGSWRRLRPTGPSTLASD
jgi:hypothetical protein